MSEKPLNRKSLKSFFSNGNRPNEDNFASLIDSMVNKVDDGISKNMEDGLVLSPESSESDRMISFYENVQNDLPNWTINIQQESNLGLAIDEPVSESEIRTKLFLKKNGGIGIDTVDPVTDFHVKGISGADARIGTYKLSTIPADGKWHDIIPDLNGCCGFEIVAQVGKQKTGKYALMHAHALSTFGKSRSKIKTTQAHYGWWWNKIALRWTGTTYDFSLQMRTRSNYGKDQNIKFYVTKIWGNDIMSLFEKDI